MNEGSYRGVHFRNAGLTFNLCTVLKDNSSPYTQEQGRASYSSANFQISLFIAPLEPLKNPRKAMQVNILENVYGKKAMHGHKYISKIVQF